MSEKAFGLVAAGMLYLPRRWLAGTRMSGPPQKLDDRVLVHAAGGRDTELISIALSDAGMAPVPCSGPAALCEAIADGAGCALIADELLTDSALDILSEVINRQPDWSDFPLLVITAIAARSRSNQRISQLLHRLGNAILLDRPLRPDTLVSAVRIALRGRRRQYQMRHHLTERDAANRLQRFLIDFNDALRAPQDPGDIATTAAAAIGRHLGVPCVAFREVDADGHSLRVAGDYSDGARPCSSIGSLASLGDTCLETLRTGERLAISDTWTDPRVGGEAAAMRKAGVRAMLAVPLLRTRRLAAVMLLTDDRTHLWSRQDMMLLDRVAERTWIAVERALTERALRESEENLRLALSMGPTIVFKQDGALRYTWVAGIDENFVRERMLGRSDLDLLPMEHAGPLEAIKRRVLESGISAREEIAARLEPKGAVRQFDLILEPILGGTSVVGLRGAAIDITDQHRTRLALEQALLAKSRFLAAASHDLRQPFQAMRLFHHILMSQLTDPHSLKVGESLLAAMESGEALLHSLLDVSTLDAGTVQPTLSHVDVPQMLNRLLSDFRPSAAEKGLHLRAHLRPTVVRSDPVLLERIFRNLLANAVRYTQSGGVLVAARRRGGCIRVEFWDTGPGIPAEDMPSIFEEFYQVGNFERDRRQGLGLGLTIVDRLARLLGLEVEARSRLGRGSVFAVSIPLATTPTPPEPWAPPPPTGLSDARILIIDDDPVRLQALKRILEELGCKVAGAVDEEEALGHVKRRPLPQIILSDLHLRGSRTGYQAVERIRRFVRSPIPALILTRETAPAYLAFGDRPDYRILRKPIDPGDLARVIADMLGMQR